MTTTSHTSSNPSSQQMADVDERLRQAILDKRQAQIRELSERIDQLQNQTRQVTEEVREGTLRRIEDLKAARDAAASHLEGLKQATQDTWAQLLEKTDNAFQSMSDRFHAFVNGQT